jgi:hypothetical protein
MLSPEALWGPLILGSELRTSHLRLAFDSGCRLFRHEFSYVSTAEFPVSDSWSKYYRNDKKDNNMPRSDKIDACGIKIAFHIDKCLCIYLSEISRLIQTYA